MLSVLIGFNTKKLIEFLFLFNRTPIDSCSINFFDFCCMVSVSSSLFKSYYLPIFMKPQHMFCFLYISFSYFTVRMGFFLRCSFLFAIEFFFFTLIFQSFSLKTSFHFRGSVYISISFISCFFTSL